MSDIFSIVDNFCPILTGSILLAGGRKGSEPLARQIMERLKNTGQDRGEWMSVTEKPSTAQYFSMNKSQKFVMILQRLQRSNGALADELIGSFDLDDRTLRRYLKDLEDIGIPVRRKGRGSMRRIFLDAAYQRSGVKLTLLEWVSLHFGRTLFQFLDGTGFAQDMDEALERLSNLAGHRNLKMTKNLERKFLAVPEHSKDFSERAETIDDILTALIYQNPATAFYKKIGGRTRRYELLPYTLATYRHGLYLFAYDVVDQKLKTFALDRFHSFKRQRSEHFELPEDYRPEGVIENAFGIIGGEAAAVSLLFNRHAVPYIQERTWHSSQQVSEEADGRLRLDMQISLSPELRQWIMGFGPDVKVLLPASLREEVRELHRRAAGSPGG
jgi:predicted DNA-binding transcriptional regulator YafY